MLIAKKRYVIYSLAILLFIFWAEFPLESRAQQLPPQDIVLLIDCSESASPYLSAVAGIMSRFLSGARPGDSVTCYQFSNNQALVEKRTIRKPDDVAQLQSKLLNLGPTGKYTNYFPALQKGLADMKALYAQRPANDRILILITDGRRHAADTPTEGSKLRRLLQKYPDVKAGEDYFFYCFNIGERVERDLESYLLSAGAYLARWREDKEWLDLLVLAEVRIMDQIHDLGQIPNTPAHSSFSMTFYPRRPPKEFTMIEIDIEAEFTEPTLDRFFNMTPRQLVCQREPWTQTFSVETRGFARDKYTGTFVFHPSEPHTLLVHPRLTAFSFSIAEPLRVLTPVPLKFGPTDFRGEYRETRSICIIPGGTDFPDSLDAVSVATDIELPDALQLDFSPVLKENEIVINISLSRYQTLTEEAGGKREGKITLISPDNWIFTDAEIPISVKIARRGLNFWVIALYSGLAAGCALAVAALVFSSSTVREAISDYLIHKTRPVGKLIVISDPTRGVARNANLAQLSEKKRTREVLIGTGEEVDVDLPHRSMLEREYKFWGLKTRHGVHTVVEALKDADEVLVNDRSRTGLVQLKHLDTVRLGEFEFRYEVPKPLQQVVLYF
ncbi:MAG: VWA domain-containing protein, partial [Candidatus Hydrogenedentota bacterium]